MSREDADLASLALEALEGEGIRFHLETMITKVAKDSFGVAIDFTQNSQEKVQKGSHLFVAIGRSPNTSGLGTSGCRGQNR
jgi:pyruvate/2-oxoglutarate dehydrogenase complex dihydrolipoamide dehydrogenase (E3) component